MLQKVIVGTGKYVRSPEHEELMTKLEYLGICIILCMTLLLCGAQASHQSTQLTVWHHLTRTVALFTLRLPWGRGH